jgi:hypothetical protein
MVDEIRQKMRLSENQTKQITRFLNEYEFITVDDTKSGIKLKETARKFLSQTATS